MPAPKQSQKIIKTASIDDIEENTDSTTHATQPAASKSNAPSSSTKDKKPETARNSTGDEATTSPSNKPNLPTTSPPTLTLSESTGDIFSAPPNTLLIHACNCEGSWAAGIAAAFRSHYPNASKIYSAHCTAHGHSLFGRALLIPPSEGLNKSQHFVGCLFTSRSKGKKKDSPERILAATGPAMRDLMRLVREYEGGEEVGEVRTCKINSGLFAVKWEKTKGVMEGIEVGEGDFREVKVVSREE